MVKLIEFDVPYFEFNERIAQQIREQVKDPIIAKKVINHVRRSKSNQKINHAMDHGFLRLSQDISASLRQNVARHTWKGVLIRSIQARNFVRGRYGVTIADYGFYLDRMRPHFVSVRRPTHGVKGRATVQDWANERISGGKKFRGRKVWVKPHPFITRSIRPRSMGQRLARYIKEGMAA